MSPDTPIPDERRTDGDTRVRVAQIQGRWEGAVRRMWIAIIGLYICAAISAYFLWDAYNNVQESRVENLRAGCENTNAQNQAIRAILTASRATIRERQFTGQITEAEAVKAQHRIDNYVARFPIIRDCRGFAEQRAAVG